MLKSAVRAVPRCIVPSRTIAYRRTISTAPPARKSRTWKGAAVRWGLAAAGVYYYNTGNFFAEEPEAAIQRLDESIHHIQESKLPTVDAIVEEKKQRQAQALAEENKRQLAAEASVAAQEAEAEEEGGELEDLEEEADQQGAFNPETGEINWDCPCLGGMAHGPCGEEFKAAFSCFVYSKEEPKGVECIDKFKGMQDCFRAHPEMYASELEDDEDAVEEELQRRESAGGEAEEVPKELSASQSSQPAPEEQTPKASEEKKPVAKKQTSGQPDSRIDGEELVPRAAHDAAK